MRHPNERIADEILAKIQSGVYAPGDRLPGENELMRTYNVARMTARAALRNLRDAGFVVVFRGRGHFVRVPMRGMAEVEIRYHNLLTWADSCEHDPRCASLRKPLDPLDRCREECDCLRVAADLVKSLLRKVTPDTVAMPAVELIHRIAETLDML